MHAVEWVVGEVDAELGRERILIPLLFVPAPREHDGVVVGPEQREVGGREIRRILDERAGEHPAGLRRIVAADGRDARRRRQRWRHVLLEAKDVRLPPVVARPADGVDGPHPVLVERARRGDGPHDVARRRREVEHVEPVHVEAGADRACTRFGERVEKITPGRDGVVGHGLVSAAERPMTCSGLVGEHGLPRPERGPVDRAVLELVHRRVQRRRSRRVWRPRH